MNRNNIRTSAAARAASLLLLLTIAAPAESIAAGQITWQCSTSGSTWINKGEIAETAPDNDKSRYIEVKRSETRQPITAWGGCFNEQGWDALLTLLDDDRTNVLKALFDPRVGLKLNLCRTPIGASDYAMSSYSLDDSKKPDLSLSHFSINRDKERLIPYIKAAMEVNPDLKLWAVPWSPPGWMKLNNSIIGGNINDSPETLDALALYFEKYVQAYHAEGIPVEFIMPQNEPTESTNYPSCLWTGAQLDTFIRDHLGPKFAADSVDCGIWLGTFTNADYSLVGPTIEDPKAFPFLKGASFQWKGYKVATKIHADHPDFPLMQSETICGNAENDWKYAESQFDLIKTYFDAGVSSYMLWNMVLDETGRSTGGWAQCSPIVINKAKRMVIYNPQYYVFKHFSYYVKPGAHYLAADGNFEDRAAFLNPDGKEVLVAKNKLDTEVKISIYFDGQEISPTLPAHSVSTFCEK